MKKINKFVMISMSILSLTIITGCAAGAATAGYALKAQSADSLTTDAEQRIVERTKREVMAELSGTNPFVSRGQ